MPNSRSYNKTSWTNRCSGLARCRCRIRSSMCQLHHKTVSCRAARNGAVIILLTKSTVKGKTPVSVQEEDDEEEELRKLQAEMAM